MSWSATISSSSPSSGASFCLFSRMPRYSSGAMARPGSSICPHPDLAQQFLRRSDCYCGVRSLVRVHPDHHCRHQLPLSARALAGSVAGMPNSGSVSGRTSFEPRHGKGPADWHIDLKPGQAAGRRFGSQPTGPFKRYDQHRSASMNN
jgi:hypothetical protein